jgi:hypothetical protein
MIDDELEVRGRVGGDRGVRVLMSVRHDGESQQFIRTGY